MGALGGPHGPGGVCRSASRSRETLLHEGRAAGGRHSGASGGWAEGLQEVTAGLQPQAHLDTFSANGGNRDWGPGCVKETLDGRRSASQF